MKFALFSAGAFAVVALIVWLRKKTPADVSSEWLRAQIYEKNGY